MSTSVMHDSRTTDISNYLMERKAFLYMEMYANLYSWLMVICDITSVPVDDPRLVSASSFAQQLTGSHA
eukprot:scaffold1280_cov379-Prasinococcus_capsulatus_cf.AAC.30